MKKKGKFKKGRGKRKNHRNWTSRNNAISKELSSVRKIRHVNSVGCRLRQQTEKNSPAKKMKREEG